MSIMPTVERGEPFEDKWPRGQRHGIVGSIGVSALWGDEVEQPWSGVAPTSIEEVMPPSLSAKEVKKNLLRSQRDERLRERHEERERKRATAAGESPVGLPRDMSRLVLSRTSEWDDETNVIPLPRETDKREQRPATTLPAMTRVNRQREAREFDATIHFSQTEEAFQMERTQPIPILSDRRAVRDVFSEPVSIKRPPVAPMPESEFERQERFDREHELDKKIFINVLNGNFDEAQRLANAATDTFTANQLLAAYMRWRTAGDDSALKNIEDSKKYFGLTRYHQPSEPTATRSPQPSRPANERPAQTPPPQRPEQRPRPPKPQVTKQPAPPRPADPPKPKPVLKKAAPAPPATPVTPPPAPAIQRPVGVREFEEPTLQQPAVSTEMRRAPAPAPAPVVPPHNKQRIRLGVPDIDDALGELDNGHTPHINVTVTMNSDKPKPKPTAAPEKTMSKEEKREADIRYLKERSLAFMILINEEHKKEVMLPKNTTRSILSRWPEFKTKRKVDYDLFQHVAELYHQDHIEALTLFNQQFLQNTFYLATDAGFKKYFNEELHKVGLAERTIEEVLGIEV